MKAVRESSVYQGDGNRCILKRAKAPADHNVVAQATAWQRRRRYSEQDRSLEEGGKIMFFNGQRVSALVFSTCMALFYGSVYADDVEPEIKVLSNRADLISGGDALVEIVWGGAAHSNVTRIELNGVDVESAFATRANGRYMGLVTGLKEGDNLLTVRVGGAGRQITITNH